MKILDFLKRVFRPWFPKGIAGGPIPMEMQRWENERSGNIGFAVQHFLELQKLLLHLAGSDYNEKRVPAK